MRALMACAAVGLVVVVAGCTSVSAGQPVPATSTTAAEGTVAPPVTQPALSFGRFASDPCQLVRREQLAVLGTTQDSGKATVQVVGPECAWQPDASSGTAISVTLLINTRGLDALYSTRGDDFGYFKPTEISGYPAVNTDIKKPIGRTTPFGDCFTAVAIAKAVAFRASAHASPRNPDYEEPCKASDRVAAMVLENLKAGG